MTKSATRIQDKDSLKRVSVVQSREDPTKYGLVILNPNGTRIQGGGGGGGTGDVVGPVGAIDGNVAVFDGATGKAIKDGGVALSTLSSGASLGATSVQPGDDVSDLVNDAGYVTNSIINDTAYGSSWDTDTTHAPTKNAVYDKLNSMDTDIGTNTSAIATINGKIPSEATSSNQLADKNYVNDGINSVTAYYITKNAQGDQWSTRAELFAATTFYSGGVVRVPTKNDYTIVLADEQHDNACTRYIYNSGWEYQYTVNETALTQAQLNAINSGITSAKVSSYDGYATSKQDTLVSGTNIKTINNISLLGSGNISISGDAKVFTYPSVGSDVSDLRDWAWLNHKTAFLNTTGTLQYVDNYVVTQCVEYGLGGGYNEIYATNGNSVVKIEVDGDTNTVVSITTTPLGGIQEAPNSPITGIKYVWRGSEAQYQALSQYYTDVPGDTEFRTYS